MARTSSHGSRWSLLAAAAAVTLSLAAAGVTIAGDASELPPTWHVHDGKGATLGAQHKATGFFPSILGITLTDYLLDPARCPNATDKAFLPSADTAQGPFLRAGQCRTSTVVIQLRTVPVGTSGPDGWSVLFGTDGGAWDTYYQVTPR